MICLCRWKEYRKSNKYEGLKIDRAQGLSGVARGILPSRNVGFYVWR